MCTEAFYNTESGASKVYKEKIHMRLEKLLGLGAVFVVLAVAASSQMGPVGVAQADCTVTVKPGESIQRAIDGAKAGAVVCLTAGEWEENIVIEKSLTLRGGSPEQTVIDGVREGYPVVWVRMPEQVQVVVQLEGLRITGAEVWCADIDKSICAEGVLLQGSAQATITNSTLSENGWDGIWLGDSAQATISNSTLSENGGYGIWLEGSAQATITNSTLFGNRWDGIWLGGSAQATISGSIISGNRYNGIWLGDSAQVTISNSTLSENEGVGIGLGGSAQATITNSTLSENRDDGIFLWNSAQATISHSIISGNRSNGIWLWDSAQATITNNLFKGNMGCGIYSYSSMEVRGEANKMADNGNDLCGNIPGSLRLPLRDPTEEEITWPDERYKSLQEAVDALLPKGKLRLKAGEHQAGVTITKELRVEAEEGEKVTLIAKSEKAPVLSLVGVAKVELVGLKLSKGEESLLLGADAQATITNSALSENGGYGIWLEGSAQATISGSTLSGNGEGIVLRSSAQAAISNSTLSGNWRGITLMDSAQAAISNSTLSGNWDDGIELTGSAQATISGSIISGNRHNGIELTGSATVTLKESTVEKNGTSESCTEADWICNGITVSGESQTTIVDSKVINNADWGVAAVQEKCGYREDNFTGKVVFEGTNTIEGNNTSGNQNSMGNPGNHPWNQPNVPDGQVCLRVP
jgi:parallel beta-helix repeat protein